jgi:hypothetical protein
LPSGASPGRVNPKIFRPAKFLNPNRQLDGASE